MRRSLILLFGAFLLAMPVAPAVAAETTEPWRAYHMIGLQANKIDAAKRLVA